MLSGEGNDNGENNNNMSNQQKSNFARAALFFCTFLYRCLARLQRETSRNFLATRFMEEMAYVFLFTFFPLSLIFSQVAASISYFLTATTKFHVVPLTKNVPFVFFFLDLAHFLVELRWSVVLLSHFLCLSLSISLFSKFVDMTINLNLTLQTTGYKNIFRFLYLTLQLSLLQKTGVAIRFPAKITRHLAPAYMKWVYGRSAFLRYVTTKFSRMDSFLTYGAPLARQRARAPLSLTDIYFQQNGCQAITMQMF